MRIESLEWRNFNSYGNVAQRIDFSPAGELYNLHGPNGSGKSTIAEALTFALYGKVEGKTKSDLVNRTNKAMWCRVSLTCRSKKVVVERGASPNVFEVTIDGSPIDTAGTANVQDFLDEEVYEIPYSVFKNILVLRIGDFKSFLSMTPADKRNIVDRLFGFGVINSMREELKIQRREVRESSIAIAADVRSTLESIDAMKARLEAAVERDATDRERMLEDLKGKIMEAKGRKEKIGSLLEKAETGSSRLSTERSALVRDLDRMGHELATIRKRLALLDGGFCPYCDSDLTGHSHVSMGEELRKKEADLSSEEARTRASLAEVRRKEDALQAKVREVRSELFAVESSLSAMTADARSILSAKPEAADAMRDLMRESSERVTERQAELLKAEGEERFLSAVDDVLGDSGVKSFAMKTVLPTLNQAVRDISKRMHVPYDISLDETFDCVVTHRGEVLSTKTLSTGERKKTDIAIIIALVRMLKLRYPSLNLLFLDELFTGMDSGGIYEANKLLSELCRDHEMNIWVMHHAELPGDMFDKQVTVTKDSGFSKVNIEPVS